MHETDVASSANYLGWLCCCNNVLENLRVVFRWRPVPLIFVRVVYATQVRVSTRVAGSSKSTLRGATIAYTKGYGSQATQ